MVAHGNQTHIQIETATGATLIGPEAAAALIQNSPGYTAGQNIGLLSCSTGAYSTGFAQGLADELGVNVLAPSDILFADSNGNLFVTSASQIVDPLTGRVSLRPVLPANGSFSLFTPTPRVQ